ncbi:MAG: phosphoenolpyruvate carboxylase [Cyclobacteriaceae bacterium]|nr:MAG: phosphoenolpyruvate carboxylase [Cyclobacteriaceae bacterium]
MLPAFQQYVATRYHIYNSLFLNLPFDKIYQTGTLLPLFQQYAARGFEQGKDPAKIVEGFFKDYCPGFLKAAQTDLLFRFIQYVERQIVLFDSIEDAAFEKLNDPHGAGTITALLLRAAAEKRLERLQEKLSQFSVRVVLTAHPTQFYPGTVLGIINDLEQAIRQNDLSEVNLLLQQLGKTPVFNREKPTPYQEAVSLCWYLENVFYHTVPEILWQLITALNRSPLEWQNYNLLRIGFWPGGDRDGNPYVTHQTTLQVAARLKETALKCYHRHLRALRRRLTFRDVYPLVTNVERQVYEAIYYPGKGYASADELLHQLGAIRHLLHTHHQGLFTDLLDAFIIRVKLFGFFMATLDLRQNSREHRLAWHEWFSRKGTDYQHLQEDERVNLLLNTHTDFDNCGPLMAELVATFRAAATIQQQNGEAGCHRYIISNCASAADVLEVYQLARLTMGNRQGIPLDVVPLFESIDDLAQAGHTMDKLYRIPEYRSHLAFRQNTQTIMLGFSDGTKDGGYLRANWSIYRAKEELTRISRQHGVRVIFFDGRGGPPARGGGNTHDFYASLGNTIENHEVQITIQGQTISSNFGKPASCRYNLEQLLSAGLEGYVFADTQYQLTESDKKLLDELAAAGYKAYVKLKHHRMFTPYLEKATPLRYFSETNIASRPVKRTASAALKLEDLRAIPFVGSWALMKQNIPGFYGVGTALEQARKKGRLNHLRQLYANSLFFRTLLSNSMMSLAKTFYPATRYLSRDREFGALWRQMYREFELACARLPEVTGLKELMEDKPLNRESVRLREQIMLPLIVIQQYALQQLRKRKADAYEQQYHRLVLRSMFGIINGSRNSA